MLFGRGTQKFAEIRRKDFSFQVFLSATPSGFDVYEWLSISAYFCAYLREKILLSTCRPIKGLNFFSSRKNAKRAKETKMLFERGTQKFAEIRRKDFTFPVFLSAIPSGFDVYEWLSISAYFCVYLREKNRSMNVHTPIYIYKKRTGRSEPVSDRWTGTQILLPASPSGRRCCGRR